jgi:hydroxymethylpyrimidine/phosphomethylpyrimidine kinase
MPSDRGPIRTALAIAGSDSGGGAGIQADLKAFARCGVHGTTAITAITAQNTTGVSAVHAVPPQAIIEQVRAVSDDIGIDAVKVGMLGSAATVAAVDEALDLVAGAPVVVDPVMVAESGAPLLDDDARDALRELISNRATVVTPNVSEARILTGAPGGEPAELARAVAALGVPVAVVTGGHAADGTDAFFDGRDLVAIPGQRHPDGAAHGSGCTHSSVLAAYLARGASPLEAARGAREIATAAVRDGLRELGAGAGPVDALGIRERRGEL